MRNVIALVGAAVGLLALAALFLGHLLLIHPGWEEIAKVLTPFDAAAWVQAVGSILAILSAAVFVRWQHDLEQARNQRAERELRRRKLDVVVELARATSHSVGYVREFFTDRDAVHEIANGRRTFDSGTADGLGSLLAEIPLHELDDPMIVNEILILKLNAQQMRDMVKALFAHHQAMDARGFQVAFHSLNQCVDGARRSHERIKSRAEALVPRSGH